MFQLLPVHRPQAELREIHCCCVPELICPSTLQSARNPPLPQPPSQRLMSPFRCTRRMAVACETAQMLMLFSRAGTTARFSIARQKLQMELLFPIQPPMHAPAPATSHSS